MTGDPPPRSKPLAVASGLAAIVSVAGSLGVAWIEREARVEEAAAAREIEARESEVVRTLVGVIERTAGGCGCDNR